MLHGTVARLGSDRNPGPHLIPQQSDASTRTDMAHARQHSNAPMQHTQLLARGTSDQNELLQPECTKGGSVKRRRSACLKQAFGRPCALSFAAEPRGDGG
eukprot:2949951-Prymnesium_polylepis.1